MTTTGGGGTAAAAARPGTAGGGITAPAEAAKRSQPVPATTVAEAVRRRAAGESFAAIGRALGVAPRRVSQWCRAAAPEAALRRPRATTKSRPVAVRLPLRIDTEVRSRAQAGNRAVGAVLVDLIAAALANPERATDAALSTERRRLLSEELIAATNAVSSFEVQVRTAGRLLNQIAKYLGVYRELPLSLTDELAASRSSLDALSDELTALRASVDRLVA